MYSTMTPFHNAGSAQARFAAVFSQTEEQKASEDLHRGLTVNDVNPEPALAWTDHTETYGPVSSQQAYQFHNARTYDTFLKKNIRNQRVSLGGKLVDQNGEKKIELLISGQHCVDYNNLQSELAKKIKEEETKIRTQGKEQQQDSKLIESNITIMKQTQTEATAAKVERLLKRWTGMDIKLPQEPEPSGFNGIG